MDKEQVRSLALAFLMIGSVMLGLFFLGVETDVSDQPPTITGEEPGDFLVCLLYTSPSPRDRQKSRMPSSA